MAEEVKKTEEKKQEKAPEAESVEISQEKKENSEAVSAENIPTKKKKKIKRQIQKGQAHIQCSYNNTLITISDSNGEVLAWSSSGLLGFKGAKKSTPFASTQVAGDVSEKIKKYGTQELEVFVKGVGSGREAAIRALVNRGFNLISIKDITPIPHNGCRPRKPRRV